MVEHDKKGAIPSLFRNLLQMTTRQLRLYLHLEAPIQFAKPRIDDALLLVWQTMEESKWSETSILSSLFAVSYWQET